MLNRIIPSSGEQITVIGLGTWNTFDVPLVEDRPELREVVSLMMESGSALLDTSPMYGHAESIIGELTTGADNNLFYATKVWTTGKKEGIQQMESSLRKMKRKTMDLMQVHNLTDWKTQLQTLREWKAEGRIRYLGITHYTDSMHGELERIMRSEPMDFVQFNYSIFNRHAEKSLLQSAADNGVATIINRPFGEGTAFSRTRNKLLPGWARELGIETWSQFFLVYLISDPAVTVVIPATADPVHARQNFHVGSLPLADETLRKKMRAYADNI